MQSDGVGGAWATTHGLIRAMTTGGEDAAALVLRAADGEGDLARTLAYRLHLICERRGWERSAGAYNSLVVAWPELVRLAAGPSLAQQSLGL